MSAATGPINAQEAPIGYVNLGVAAATIIYAGTMVAKHASGHAAPASTAAGLAGLGRAEATVDNSAGAAADLSIVVKPGVFAWNNSGNNALTIADIGKKVWVEDDNTVAGVTGTHGTVAGIFLGFDEDDDCWIDTRGNAGPVTAITDGTTNGAAAAAADLAALKAETELLGDLARALKGALQTAGIIV